MLNITHYINNLFFDIEDVIIDPYILNNGRYISLNSKNISFPTFHRRYGLCYTLDIRMEDNIGIIKAPVTFGCNPQRSVQILFHDIHDLPGAEVHSTNNEVFYQDGG